MTNITSISKADKNFKWTFENLTALQSQYPVWNLGDFAILSDLDQIYTWDITTSAWVSTWWGGETTGQNIHIGNFMIMPMMDYPAKTITWLPFRPKQIHISAFWSYIQNQSNWYAEVDETGLIYTQNCAYYYNDMGQFKWNADWNNIWKMDSWSWVYMNLNLNSFTSDWFVIDISNVQWWFSSPVFCFYTCVS